MINLATTAILIIVYAFAGVAGADISMSDGAIVWENHLPMVVSFQLKGFIFTYSKDYWAYDHELGHMLQEREMGAEAYTYIAISSIVQSTIGFVVFGPTIEYHNWFHSLYWENDADIRGL